MMNTYISEGYLSALFHVHFAAIVAARYCRICRHCDDVLVNRWRMGHDGDAGALSPKGRILAIAWPKPSR